MYSWWQSEHCWHPQVSLFHLRQTLLAAVGPLSVSEGMSLCLCMWVPFLHIHHNIPTPLLLFYSLAHTLWLGDSQNSLSVLVQLSPDIIYCARACMCAHTCSWLPMHVHVSSGVCRSQFLLLWVLGIVLSPSDSEIFWHRFVLVLLSLFHLCLQMVRGLLTKAFHFSFPGTVLGFSPARRWRAFVRSLQPWGQLQQ